jgi:hypothetical protein
MERKIKVTKLSAIGIVLSIMMMAIFPVFAEFEQTSQTGSWEICERTHWKENLTDTIGFAEWNNKTMVNFTGYYATIRFSELTTAGTGFWFWENYAETNVYVFLNFTGSTGTQIMLKFDFLKRLDLWGVLGKLQVLSYATENGTHYNFMGDTLSLVGYTEVYVYKNGGNLTLTVYNYQTTLENAKKLTEVTFNVGEAWFNEVSFDMTVSHDGMHPYKFDGYLENEDFNYTIGTLPTEKGLAENIFDVFVRGLINSIGVIPQWLKSITDMMFGWLTWLFSITGGILVSIVHTAIPFLPLLLIFYVLDAGITSVYTGSITPIGNCFLTLYNFTVTVISAIVAITGTIYDFIHFW